MKTGPPFPVHGTMLLSFLFAPAAFAGGFSLGTTGVTDHVQNPTSGASLAVYLALPDGPAPHRAVVMVPGGLHPAGNDVSQGGINKLLRENIAVLQFDADGRGQSTGEEDYNGPKQQAGVRAVIKWLEARDDIEDGGVGVVSYSFGISMATGALAGGETGAKFLVDWEGPPSSKWMEGCRDNPTGENPGVGNHKCDDTEFWSTRQAVNFVSLLKVPYIRIQTSVDHHGHSDKDKVYEIMDAVGKGHLPWFQMNDLKETTKAYSHSDLDGALLSPFEGDERDAAVAKYVVAAFKSLGIK